MTKPQPYGTFPTPYGVSVPVYRPDPIDPADPEQVLFSMDATAICAGIHDPVERARFAADAKRLGRAPAFEEYGGGKLLHVPLPMPRKPAYPRVAGMEADLPIEAWTTGLLDRFRWCDRAEFCLEIISQNQESAIWARNGFAAELLPLGLSIMLTAALEHLCETEIDCVEAAALYAVTEHAEWRKAGAAWLLPVRDTWFRDWRAVRPGYVNFARALHGILDVPPWTFEPATGRGGAA